MKKIIALLIGIFVVLGALASCGDNGTSGSTQPSTAPSGEESVGGTDSCGDSTGAVDSSVDSSSGAVTDSTLDSNDDNGGIGSGSNGGTGADQSEDVSSGTASDVESSENAGDESDAESSENVGDESDVESSADDVVDSSDAADTEESEDSGNNEGTESSDSKAETVTVEFKLWAGSIVSGNSRVEIEKGSELDPEQIPEVKRNGYVLIGWAYDAIGSELWAQGDIFNEDTTLFANWKKASAVDSTVATESTDSSVDTTDSSVEDDTTDSSVETTDSSKDNVGDDTDNDNNLQTEALINQLKQAMAIVGQNYEARTETALKTPNEERVENAVTKANGQDEYLKIEANGMVEEMWYVDGVFYTVLSGNKVSMVMDYEEYTSNYRAMGPASLGAILAVSTDWITEAKMAETDGDVSITVVVSGKKYTAAVSSFIDIVYTDLTYTLCLSSSGEIDSATVEYGYEYGGIAVKCFSKVIVANVGSTVVEAPENKDEYEEFLTDKAE